ncbi:MAG: FxsA family protein [Parvularculaceae bacterium]|nr:FxsA family protein [Parvularculaceae bacterium]
MSIGIILFILFVGVPILEIAAFIKIGGWIGLLPTLLGCVVTAVIGAFLVRLQGFEVIRRAQTSLARSELPVDQLAHGVFILIAGVLLMTPGYVTDAMGFLLLVPPLRLQIARGVMAYLKDHAAVQVSGSAWGYETREDTSSGVTIEGEAVEVDDGDGHR